MHDALIFDDLTRIVAQPRADWRRHALAISMNLGGKFATGLAVGVGFAIGLALAG
ncbi:hypothetical protein [Mesorhizobium sp. M7A.F.Ca.MR.176.00.0.0]|uniref:hypothetical protein n=1 Tax=Mesorhizobium sp. M7A.F.Ca.MR.176.00.0.0 TaxID=2496776 RepID=UPI0013E3612F|nr:hypothetical protein [Mesorhizobium sp. M7A.F.Ca.MR.176.00.0.0]